MSRYRVLPVTTWLELSRFGPIPPSPHALLIYLRTNKLTTGIPGLYAAGEGSLSEGLMWSLKDFRRCWTALHDAKFAIEADWEARVVFMACDLIEPNKPANPNVVKSWALPWREIPSCPLKMAAREMIRSFIARPPEKLFQKRFREGSEQPSREQSRTSFLEAFDEACPDGLGNQSRNQESGIRKQESGGASPARDPWRSGYGWLDAFRKPWADRHGRVTYANGGDGKATRELEDGVLAHLPEAEGASLWEQRQAMFASYLDSKDPYLVKANHPFALFVVRFSDFRPDVKAAQVVPTQPLRGRAYFDPANPLGKS